MGRQRQPHHPEGSQIQTNFRDRRLVTSNLSSAERTEVLGSKRLTGALLDRLTHHVRIPEMNGESFRLKNSKKRKDDRPGSTPKAARAAFEAAASNPQTPLEVPESALEISSD
jgi:hypothetical protein